MNNPRILPPQARAELDRGEMIALDLVRRARTVTAELGEDGGFMALVRSLHPVIHGNLTVLSAYLAQQVALTPEFVRADALAHLDWEAPA